ncbi:ATPase [uncultured Methanobrevibacter sp.]|uniref:ATPase n=1 Tax=uncultured Methanobrevibacter sp. TaxID=253161 RepID=UPI00262E2847|nr:ATPase [uncultured Methanobrevibacter sp.]
MNGTTLLIWMNILIIAIIAIVAVKLYYMRKRESNGIGTNSFDFEFLSNALDSGKNFISNNTSKKQPKRPAQLNKVSSNKSSRKEIDYDSISIERPVIYEVENDNKESYGYKSPNQVLVNYDNTVQKFQEPIKQNQMDIMTKNNDPNEKHELKDLFTIDELIKESKRKDSEREKESQSIKKDDDDDLTEIKESIKQRKENKQEEPLIEEIIQESDDSKEETINDIISDAEEGAAEAKEEVAEVEVESATTQKDIEEAIETASQESEEEIESISETADITDALLDADKEEAQEEEIKEPILKSPKKVDESKKDFGEAVFEDENDLDYRKDLAKITNTIKGSKIYQDVKERFTSPQEPEDEIIEESYIRNVNEYEDEFAPIINETHADFEATYEQFHDPFYDEELRRANTQRVFNKGQAVQSESPIGSIKEKPARDNMKIKIGNSDVVLKKGDEIIFNHLGETYSSQVYAINGDEISVKYRRQNITIKASDVKKVY